jgi:hypothetical protein
VGTLGNGVSTLIKATTVQLVAIGGVLRGGYWATSNRLEMQSPHRNVVDRNERDVIYGFRCVLATKPDGDAKNE